jgi:hypothetical protein
LVKIISKDVEPNSLNPDPDPAFQVNSNPIRIQGFDDQKLNEKYSRNFFYLVLIKNCNLDLLNPVPDPAFQVNPDPDPGF